MNSTQNIHIALIGPPDSGKSALIQKFVQNNFISDYDPTVEDSYRKQVLVDDVVTMLDIFDTPGQEEYAKQRQTIIEQVQGIILTYSITSRSSFKELQNFFDQVLQIRCLNPVSLLLLGTKADLESLREVSCADGQNLCNSYGCCSFLEISSNSSLSDVSECFFVIVRDIRRVQGFVKSDISGVVKKKTKRRGCSLM
eukprot:TRINITY_DN13836_c0_g1_i1.p1 TRINITY_DN13836_c0_g1~~TRINITY_DN13836_c0_g1_i1.p1  ORF type:complete len:197 (-),score=31.71 TRINITY_DN13836_c0_g1_i1:23-613(-)